MHKYDVSPKCSEFIPYLRAYEKYLLQSMGLSSATPKALLKEAIRFLVNNFAVRFPNVVIEEDSAEVLFLFSYNQSFERFRPVYEGVRSLYKVRHDYIDMSFRDPLLKRKFGGFRIPEGIMFPSRYKYLACYASYFIEKYRPKIIVTFINGGLFPAILKVVAEAHGCKVINVAHGTTETYFGNTVFTADYFFLFGPATIMRANANPVRLGSTRGVLVGSPFIPRDFELSPSDKMKNIVFLSQWLHFSEKDTVLRNVRILIRWCRDHTDYTLYVKPHPLDDMKVLRKLFRGVGNAIILDKQLSMKEALRDAALCVVQFSGSSVEAAVFKRPVVNLNDSDMPGQVDIEKYFGPRARSPEDLDRKINEVLSNYDRYVNICDEFVKWHLAYIGNSVDIIVERIKSIYEGREDFEYVNILQRTDVLEKFR